MLDRTADDLDFLASLYANPVVMRWIGDGATYDRGEIEARYARIDAIQREPTHPRWDGFKIVVRKEDGKRLGQAGLLRCEVDAIPQVEIGGWRTPSAWGHGYATEAALALCDYAFRRLRLTRLTVVLHPENHASVGVALRIGALPAGTATYRGRRVTHYLIHAATPASPAE